MNMMRFLKPKPWFTSYPLIPQLIKGGLGEIVEASNQMPRKKLEVYQVFTIV